MTTITVREYARLTTRDVINTLDTAHISPAVFDWLCELQSRWSKRESAFIDLDGAKSLRLGSYVGMLESPCGTRIEILPKTHTYSQSVEQTRALLWRMLHTYLGQDIKKAEMASIKCLHKPLSEWLITLFLQELSLLLKKGLYAHYTKVDEERTFIRGQIRMAKQMRQPIHRQHLTHVRHAVFSLDRSENRLLRTALACCRQGTQDTENWIFATTLEGMMQHILPSTHIHQDLQQWQHTRHMTHYAAIKPWCALILQKNIPMALQDMWQGISLLFPMEKIFESFVVSFLRKSIHTDVKLISQSNKEFLCTHGEEKKFNLKPDILLKQGEQKWLLDAKWKILDPAQENYKISQSDMYQLFAYGQKYLNGEGHVALVYPQTDIFSGITLPFSFSSKLHLHVLACDLNTGQLVPYDNARVFPLKDTIYTKSCASKGTEF